MDKEMEKFIHSNESTIDDFEDIKKLADYIGVKPETVILYRIQQNLDGIEYNLRDMGYDLRDMTKVVENKSENNN